MSELHIAKEDLKKQLATALSRAEEAEQWRKRYEPYLESVLVRDERLAEAERLLQIAREALRAIAKNEADDRLARDTLAQLNQEAAGEGK